MTLKTSTVYPASTVSPASLVSVICPVYNVEKYLDSTVTSVLAQTYPHWELLLIMDVNSSDGSLDLAHKWSSRDPRILVLESASQKGVANNRNQGILKASGYYTAFLDSDDLWHPQKLEKQILFMSTRGAEFSYHSYQQISPAGDPLPLIRHAPPQITYTSLLKTNAIGCLTVMVRSSWIKRHAFSPNLPHEDFLLWLELLKETSQAQGLGEVLAYYRVLPQSRSSNKKHAARDRWMIYRKILRLNFVVSIYYFTYYAITALSLRLKLLSQAIDRKQS